MIHPKNKEIFAKEATNYASLYLRADEEYCIKNYFQGKYVLVLGCGAGRVLPFIDQAGYEVTGIDVVPQMVTQARFTMSRLKLLIPFYIMDVCDLKFSDSMFDVVFFPFHGIDYTHPDVYQAIAEAKRVLKPGGVFIFNSHNRFYVRNLKNIFKSYVSDPSGLVTYRTSPIDYFKLKKIFKKVITFGRASVRVSWEEGNWKDKFLKILPWLDKSTYFVCYKEK